MKSTPPPTSEAAAPTAGPHLDDECDDIFGPPRTYPSGYPPQQPKTRLSMISAKYRQKEERRKVLKISINKLKKIEDPEATLCRSVLINNTMKRLQREARDEKIQKQQLNYPPRCYDDDTMLNIKSEFLRNEIIAGNHHHNNNNNNNNNNSISNNNHGAAGNAADHRLKSGLPEVDDDDDDDEDEDSAGVTTTTVDEDEDNTNNHCQFSNDTITPFENDFDEKLAEEINAAVHCAKFGDDEEAASSSPTSSPTALTVATTAAVFTTTTDFKGQKRSYDLVDDCDVQDVLSQFFIPPTPHMLTCIDDDDDDDGDNVDDDHGQKLDDSSPRLSGECASEHHQPPEKRIRLETEEEEEDRLMAELIQEAAASASHSESAGSSSGSSGRSSDSSRTMMMMMMTDHHSNQQQQFLNSVTSNLSRFSATAPSPPAVNSVDADANNSFSCGHASMFSDLQSNVYHNLIASLET